jgi:hypothetical protein
MAKHAKSKVEGGRQARTAVLVGAMCVTLSWLRYLAATFLHIVPLGCPYTTS